jgi:hypothetical protein
MEKKEILNIKIKSLVTLLLCMPVGLLAIYNSYKYGICMQNSKFELADKYKKRVNDLLKLSTVTTLIIFAYVLIKIIVK